MTTVLLNFSTSSVNFINAVRFQRKSSKPLSAARCTESLSRSLIMHTVKKYVFYVQLLCFVLLVNSSHENTAKNPAFFASKVNISDNFVVEWRVNDTAKNVEFKVNVTIDEKGWVLLGFMPTPKNKSSDKNHPMKLSDTRGDFLITWPSSSSERTTLVRDFLSFVEVHVLYIGPYQHTCVYNDHDIREGFRYRHYLFSKQAKTQWVSPC